MVRETDIDERSRPGTAAAERPRSRNLGIALAVISAAQLMVVLDATIVNIALPHIRADLGFSTANLTWVINAYTLAFGGLLLLGGRAGDLLGRRRMFIVGVLLFAVASLFGGLAQAEWQMIAARVLQGVAGAIASPAALSLITTTFPSGPARNRAMAVYAAMSGAGAAIGLILGGTLTSIDWRLTFYINIPIGVLVAVLAPMFLGESERTAGSFDIAGALLGTLGLVGIVYGLTHAATDGWSDPVTIACLVAGVLLLAAFVRVEARTTHPLLPIRVLAQRDRAATYVAMLAIGSAMFAMFYFLSLYIQQVLHFSPFKTGLAFLPFSIGIVVAAQVASALVSRVDPRWIAGTGAAVASLGMLWLTQLEVDSGYWLHLVGPIVTLALGLGLAFVPLTLTAVMGVETRDSGVASAVLNTTQQIGGALGLATLSTVATTAIKHRGADLGTALQQQVASGTVGQDQLPGRQVLIELASFTHGSTVAFAVATAMMAAGALVVFLVLRVRHHELAADGVAPKTVVDQSGPDRHGDLETGLAPAEA